MKKAISLLLCIISVFALCSCGSSRNEAINLTAMNTLMQIRVFSSLSAEKDVAKRAVILHDAEKKLLDDMVVIPVIFNQNATLIRKDLSKVAYGYYGNPIMTKAKLKDYEKFLETSAS